MCLSVSNLERRRITCGEHLGYEYEVVHNGMGYRCGYIKVGPNHPWYEQQPDCNVHGGITFGRHGTACVERDAKDEWWIGFDCAHSDDARDYSLPFSSEDVRRILKESDERLGRNMVLSVIRGTDYVVRECKYLAQQALEAQETAC